MFPIEMLLQEFPDLKISSSTTPWSSSNSLMSWEVEPGPPGTSIIVSLNLESAFVIDRGYPRIDIRIARMYQQIIQFFEANKELILKITQVNDKDRD